MTRSEAGRFLRRCSLYLAAASLGGAASFAVPVAAVGLAVKLLSAIADAEWVFFLKSLFAGHAAFALACAAAAGVQYFAAVLGPGGRRAGAARLAAALPGPAAGAFLFSALSGNSFFVIYKYGWAPVLAAGLLGALAGAPPPRPRASLS